MTKKDNKLHLIKVTYKGKTKHKVWDNYNLIVDNEEGEEKVDYEYINEFISYSDWCELNKIENKITDKFERTEQNSIYEEVYLNSDLRLLKMGGIEVPVKGLGGLLRAKKIEFVNVSGIELNDVIKSKTSLEFIYCTVDNLKCKQLKINFLTFNNCSVRNVEINNSEISNWRFINSIVTGKINNSIFKNTRIWGGQFIPVFYNSEPDNIGVWHNSMKHSPDFDRTYRAFYKANQDIGNYREASKFKILELDFKRAKAEGFFNKIRWGIDKYYWEYGENPKRLIYVTILFIFLFGFVYSFFPSYFSNCIFKGMSYFEILGNTLYYSVVTFTTVGYGDILPIGIMKFFASLEALLGAITIGFLVVSLGKNKE
ncbi:MAG: two pore domain potassium channel family protein [Saprospiraceae bacterium]|nr:two pore domain potassium channel family protein [Saprospiraceae bacterium]